LHFQTSRSFSECEYNRISSFENPEEVFVDKPLEPNSLAMSSVPSAVGSPAVATDAFLDGASAQYGLTAGSTPLQAGILSASNSVHLAKASEVLAVRSPGEEVGATHAPPDSASKRQNPPGSSEEDSSDPSDEGSVQLVSTSRRARSVCEKLKQNDTLAVHIEGVYLGRHGVYGSSGLARTP